VLFPHLQLIPDALHVIIQLLELGQRVCLHE
jgi:hypothetical protein